MFTIGWADLEDKQAAHWCPMNEEPLHVIPNRFRSDVEANLNLDRQAGELRARESRESSAPTAATCITSG